MFLIFSFCNKMLRKIACYVIVITLIWGAATENEEKIRNIFKSNMTRGDFSNLLKSLIRLNEQRVNVLQKLYRLDDYSVLSEVLRSGDNKKGNGNLSNLFLVVLSKDGALESKKLFSNYRTSVDDNEDIGVANDRDEHKLADRAGPELLGLVIVDHNPITRRSFDIGGGNSTESDVEDDDDDDDDDDESGEVLQPRSHRKKNNKKSRDIDTPLPPKKRMYHESDSLRIGEIGEDNTVGNSKVLRAACLSQTQKDIEKCMRACNRAHEDVCDRLSCSARSQRALRKECSFNCKKVFDPSICY